LELDLTFIRAGFQRGCYSATQHTEDEKPRNPKSLIKFYKNRILATKMAKLKTPEYASKAQIRSQNGQIEARAERQKRIFAVKSATAKFEFHHLRKTFSTLEILWSCRACLSVAGSRFRFRSEPCAHDSRGPKD
jgi:hypothetical protein